MQIRILSITARDGGAEILVRVELSEDVFDVVEGAEELYRKPHREVREFVLLLDRYAEIRPRKGLIDEATFLSLEEAAEFSEAVRLGLKLLAFGASTRRGLENKLCRKGVTRENAADASAYLAERGYIDETRDAVREAERGVQKFHGRNRIRATLYEKGYGSDAVEAAERYLNGVDFVLLCRRLVERRYGALLVDGDARKKTVAALMRNGYTMHEIRAALSSFSG